MTTKSVVEVKFHEEEPLPEEYTNEVKCTKCGELNRPQDIISTGSYTGICVFCIEDDEEDEAPTINKNKVPRYKR